MAEPSWNQLSACSPPASTPPTPGAPHRVPSPTQHLEPPVSTLLPGGINPPLAGLPSDSTLEFLVLRVPQFGVPGGCTRPIRAARPTSCCDLQEPKGITPKCLGTRGGRARPESLEHLSEQPCWRVRACQEAEVRPLWLSLPLHADGLEGGAPPESRVQGVGPSSASPGACRQRTEATRK